MSPLFSPTSSEEVKTNRSSLKIAILAIIIIVSAFFFGYAAKLFFIRADYFSFILLAVGAIVFLIFFLLNTLLIESFSISALIIFLESAAIAGAFYDRLSWILGVAVLLVFLILLTAYKSGQLEMENLIKLKFLRIAKRVVPKAVLAVALLIGVAYYDISAKEAVAPNKDIFISQQTFEQILEPFNTLVKKIKPEIDLSLPLSEAIDNLARSQIETDPKFSLLPEAMKKQLTKEAAQEFSQQTIKMMGANVSLSEKLSGALYQMLVNRFNDLSANTKDFIAIGAAAIVFLFIVGLIWPIRWVVSIMGWIIFEVFLALGFASIMMEGKSKEIIIL